MRRRLLVVFLCAIAAAATSGAQTIFLVRHAERADAGGAPEKDPALSAAGRARASALAKMLRDARISAIYVTEYRRTQETARSLAEAQGISPMILPAKETAALIAKLKASTGNVLVVGHSNTLPEIMRGFGISSSIAIGESDYGDLFLVVLAQPPRLIHLHCR